MVDPTTVAALAVRSVVPRFVAGLAAGAAAAGIIIALVIGSTSVQVGVGAVVAVVAVLAIIIARAALAPRASLRLPDGFEGPLAPHAVPQFPGGPADTTPDLPRPTAPPGAGAGSAGAAVLPPPTAGAPRREIPYWLQVTSVAVGIVTGIGGMVIAIVK